MPPTLLIDPQSSEESHLAQPVVMHPKSFAPLELPGELLGSLLAQGLHPSQRATTGPERAVSRFWLHLRSRAWFCGSEVPASNQAPSDIPKHKRFTPTYAYLHAVMFAGVCIVCWEGMAIRILHGVRSIWTRLSLN